AFNLKWFEANKTESIGVDVVGVLTLANACKDHSLPMPIKTKRVTRVELNKRLRHKEQQKKEAEAKKLEELSKEIDSIPEIMKEIKQEDEEKQKKHSGAKMLNKRG
ncbi:hypothetical protein HN873_027329, partial [Arachis hypogaea]